MRMQKFTAANNHLAMQMVHRKLGPEALIYSTRRNGKEVEIIAGLPGGPEMPVHGDATDLDALVRQISSIENNLRKLASRMDLDFSEDNTRNQLYYYLSQLGLKGRFRNDFVGRYLEEVNPLGSINSSQVDEKISELIKVDDYELIDTKNICALVGPTGVGKTTSLVKIAKRYLNRYNADSIALITTDSSEVITKNLLMTYSNVFGIDLLHAVTADELASALDRFAEKSFVLIDTSGISQKNSVKIEELMQFQDHYSGEISYYLTLSCNIQEVIMEDIARAFSPLGLSGCILTKTDESINIASAVNTCLNHDLSISYVCNGQNVYTDISPAQIDDIMSSMKSGNEVHFQHYLNAAMRSPGAPAALNREEQG